jgi:hypothetical protein
MDKDIECREIGGDADKIKEQIKGDTIHINENKRGQIPIVKM